MKVSAVTVTWRLPAPGGPSGSRKVVERAKGLLMSALDLVPIWTAILAIGTERAADHNQADIVWTARHKASLLAFGLAVHLRR